MSDPNDESKPRQATDEDGWGDVADLEREVVAHSEPPDEASGLIHVATDPLADLDRRRRASGLIPAVQSPMASASPTPDPDPSQSSRAAPPTTRDSAAEVEDIPAKWSGEPSTRIAAPAPELPHLPPGLARKKRPLTKVWFGIFVVAMALAAVFLVLSELNSRRFYLRCGAATIVPQTGRYWPWGTTTMSPTHYAAVSPVGPECVDREFSTKQALDAALLEVLLQRASSLLASGKTASVDQVVQQLTQAQRLARDPAHRARRPELQRLLVDADYWRAAAGVQAAIAKLQEAARLFDAAAERQPRHNGDARDWSAYATSMSQTIARGPRNLRTGSPKDRAGKTPHFAGMGLQGASANKKTQPAQATIDKRPKDPEPQPAPIPAPSSETPTPTPLQLPPPKNAPAPRPNHGGLL